MLPMDSTTTVVDNATPHRPPYSALECHVSDALPKTSPYDALHRVPFIHLTWVHAETAARGNGARVASALAPDVSLQTREGRSGQF